MRLTQMAAQVARPDCRVRAEEEVSFTSTHHVTRGDLSRVSRHEVFHSIAICQGRYLGTCKSGLHMAPNVVPLVSTTLVAAQPL